MRELIKTKYFKWGLTVCVSLITVVLVFFIVDKFSTIHGAFGKLINIVAPFLYGIVMAYLLRPVFEFCHYHLVKLMIRLKFESKRRIDLVAKVISVVISVSLLLVVIFALFMMVIPQLAASIYDIVVSLPKSAMKMINWIQGLDFINDGIKKYILKSIDGIVENIDGWVSDTLEPYLKEMALKVSAGIMGAASFVFDIFVGFIVCVYVLLSKNKFAAQSKKLSYSLFEKDTANTIINGVRYADKVFTGFISGNIIDALIIGALTFVFMNVFNWPFALLISAIVGVTNLIPFFGPFIGGGVGAILLLPENPVTSLYFLIFILILQQMDGNVIKPKILGQSVDLPSFWILFSILIGGGLFGFVGMILGVPVFTIIYAFISWSIDSRLSKKNLSDNTMDYSKVDYYDYDKGEFVYLPENLFEKKREKKKELKKLRKEKRKDIEE